MRFLVSIAGVLIGAFLGAALLMLNPITLTQTGPAGLAGAISALGWQSGGGYRGFAMTPAGLLGAENDDPALDFKDAGIRYARVEVVALAGDPGAPPALGVRLSAIARQSALLRARLGVTTAWSIAWPEKGTVLLSGSENYWAPLRDGLWSAVRGRGFQPGGARYALPPMAGLGTPAIVSGSGELGGAHGAFREAFSPVRERPGDLIGSRQLQLAIE